MPRTHLIMSQHRQKMQPLSFQRYTIHTDGKRMLMANLLNCTE